MVPADGIPGNDGGTGLDGVRHLAEKKRVLFWIKRVFPSGDGFEALTKGLSWLKNLGVCKTDINVLLMEIPNRPEECPLLHWVWMVEVIRDQVIETFGVSSIEVVIFRVLKPEQVGGRRVWRVRRVGDLKVEKLCL